MASELERLRLKAAKLEEEKDRLNQSLQKSENQFRLVAKTIDELIWIYDAEKQRLEYVSPAYERIYGYAIKQPNEDVTLLYDSIHSSDRDRILEAVRLMKEGQALNQEFRIVHPDGSIRHVWDRSFPVRDETRKIKKFIGITQDITSWKHAAEAIYESRDYLDQIINHIGDPIFVKDSKLRFIHVNEAMTVFAGLNTDQMLGKTVFDHLPEEMATPLWEQEEAILKTGLERVTEDKVPDAQGNLRTVLSKRSLLVDKKGNRQIIGVLRDITEYKRLEAQLLQLQKMEAIGVLAGGLAHDFNNLLTVIKGFTEILMSALDPNDPKRQDLEQIQKAEQKASTLTSQLLAFSRKQILQPEYLNLNEVVLDVSKMLGRLIGEDIELTTLTQSDLDLIHADPGQIQQIIMNLAVNARDAMPQGGKLTIETSNAIFDQSYAEKHPLAESGPYVMLAISDNGVGMDKSTQTRIFEPFFTTKTKGKGTGLGLSTVYGIIRQSNGFIWVYSELGKGTTFKVYFPRAQGEIKQVASKEIPESGSKGSETILVVEDEEAVRAMTCRVLRARGYKVLGAANGKEAIKISKEHAGDIHLVFTDVIMPEMDGKKLVSQLQASRPNLKILYTSGYADQAIVHHGILEPGVAFLQKPFAVDKLVRKVRNVLDSQH